MNETMKLLYERGSVRNFEERDIPEDIMTEILNAGCHAATGGNLQPYSIIEIRSKEKKEALFATKAYQPIIKTAPVSLLFCIDWNRIERWAKLNKAPFSVRQGFRHSWIAMEDAIIAAQTICTAADSVGLGSVYLGTVESSVAACTEIFKLPQGVYPLLILSLGYPKKKACVTKKHMRDFIVHRDEFKEITDEELNQAMDKKYDDGRNAPLSDRNLNMLYKVAEEVEGKEFAEEAVKYAKKLGYIHEAQVYFGLHYMANWSRTGNKEFIQSIKNAGYSWVDGKEYTSKIMMDEDEDENE